MTADDAVQIAMLNNRDLQALYSELGLAQADLVQAGLFRNPILDAAVFFPLSGVRPDLQLSVVDQLPGRALRPAPEAGGRGPVRRGQAPGHRGRARLRRAGADARSTSIRPNEQMLDLRQTIVQALAASLDVSRRLHEAGNITDLDLARDRAADGERRSSHCDPPRSRSARVANA